MIADVARGFSLLGRGIIHVLQRPRLLGLGALPPLLVSLGLFALLVGLGFAAEPIVGWATGFMDPWPDWIRQASRVLLVVVLVMAGAIVAVVAFATITLTVGAPIYQRISASVDADLGFTPLVGLREAEGALLTDAPRLVGRSLVVALVVFLVGLVPGVGTVAAAVVGPLLGGWLVTLELLEAPYGRRGLAALDTRRADVRRERALVAGFSVPIYAAMLIPLLGVAVFPGVVAGATFLARDLRDER